MRCVTVLTDEDVPEVLADLKMPCRCHCNRHRHCHCHCYCHRHRHCHSDHFLLLECLPCFAMPIPPLTFMKVSEAFTREARVGICVLPRWSYVPWLMISWLWSGWRKEWLQTWWWWWSYQWWWWWSWWSWHWPLPPINDHDHAINLFFP